MASNTTTFPLTGPINLVVRLGYGSITVATHEVLTEAVVRLVPRDHQSDVLDRVTVEMHGQTLLVTGPRQDGLADLIGRWRRDRDEIDAVIEVPTGTAIKISAASEDVTITGRCGDTDLATTAGRISLDTVDGNLRLRYGSANSRIGVVTGSAELGAAGGSAHFGEVGGPLECKLGSGELIVDVVRGELRLRAGSGSARIGAVYANADLAFGSGPISIGLPTGVTAQVDITSGTGEVHSDLPVEQAPDPAARAIRVRARTGSGGVRILRAVAA
jgi:hypothetical protein